MAEQTYHAVGKRKSAVARVWLRPGGGRIVVNKRPLEAYFTREVSRTTIAKPLALTDTVGRFDVEVNVRGGGISGQADAVKHGISRALLEFNPEMRPVLKKAGLLTRDPREKERKKYGQKRARKRFQYSKR
jgi:small subunit ribosomal protein S9